VADESRNEVGLEWNFFKNWLPGTEPKSARKRRELQGFWTSVCVGYPNNIPFKGGCYRTLPDRVL
jgi:hypothetical protein